jgi:deoxyribodipyrimidine photo-lyase
MSDAPVIVWFRNDLRLSDHPALTAAANSGQPVLACYIWDPESGEKWTPASASRWWLHQSLEAFAKSLNARGGDVVLRQGRPEELLPELAAEIGATAIYFTRAYEPWAIDVENKLKDALSASSVELKRYSGRLLKEPGELKTQSGNPYKVYSPFWRALKSSSKPRRPLTVPKKLKFYDGDIASDSLDAWRLQPTKPNWAKAFADNWKPGEKGAQERLKFFIKGAVADYKETRNRPDVDGTSRLSPHLHFGEISPNQCWHAGVAAMEETSSNGASHETFLKELVWREFSYSLLFHWPDLPHQSFRPEFKAFPWQNDDSKLKAWQKGETGYPIVDAGMRQLWQTGWMHNRVRMICASFLIKHLLIDWRHGEDWFWDTLVDADLANNAASWQWVAGSGADAAPYFRIFNPITQGEKFDPDGDYVRTFVPELKKLDTAFIHAPWTAADDDLDAAGVKLGKTYPRPIVDHKTAREKALAGYERVKAAKSDD